MEKTNKLLWIIIVIAVLLRLVAAVTLGNEVTPLPGTYDQVSYHTLALRVLAGQGFTFGTEWWPITGAGQPTAHWSYLYTYFLVAVYWLFGPYPLVARLIQAVVVGVAHPLLAYLLGKRLAGNQVGLLAATLTAVYTYFVYYAGTLMTEPFYITSILLVLYLALRLAEGGRKQAAYAISFGLVLGVTVLLRQLFLLFVPFLILWWWWASYRTSRTLPFRLTTLSLLTLLLLILPVTISNYVRFEQFVLLNTNAGYVLFWGNHPIYGNHFEPILPAEMGTYQDLIPVELRHLDEAALDSALLQKGLGFIVADPVRYIRLSLSRIPAYFMFWPSAGSSFLSNVARTASFGLLWPFMLAGVPLVLWRSRRSTAELDGWLLILLFAGIYTAVHLLTWALIRYRLPVDAVLLLPASFVLITVRQHLAQVSALRLSQS